VDERVVFRRPPVVVDEAPVLDDGPPPFMPEY
jgi:hypothetical protein